MSKPKSTGALTIPPENSVEKAATDVPPSSVPNERAQIELRRRDSFPSQKELWQTAAILAQGRPLGREQAYGCATQAIDLWKACGDTLSRTVAREAGIDLHTRAFAAKEPSRPWPEKFPISFKEFLTLIVPGKSESERTKRFRDYLKYGLRVDKAMQADPTGFTMENYRLAPETTLAEAGDTIAKLSSRLLNEDNYDNLSWRFLLWYNQSKKQMTHDRAVKASNVRYGKK